ncbi:MAG TPA: amidase [Steroidobacteraceae bacterium]|nr:amidase [Steroidobacteraceae bacterium]
MTQRTDATLAQLAAALAERKVKSRELVERCIANIQDSTGEGARTFLAVTPERALATADFHDAMRARGAAIGPYAGVPISIKDLFDVTGEITTAGSKLLRTAPPATRDAVAVARLRAAGFVILGRTNMTEFAFSGLGLNPHYSTPRNPWERTTGRIPGGSSSGAAISITDGMAFAALGTDTGGSCRIPAAFCGIVGYKPTARRVPRAGTFPLSMSLDSIGPLANTVACCAAVDAILADEAVHALPAVKLGGLRFGVPQSLVLDGLDADVAAAFERALGTLSSAGARIIDVPLVELKELQEINRKGGLATAEAYAVHRKYLATAQADYDPRVATRILRGREQDAADYIELLQRRHDFIERVAAVLAPFDAMLMPTVAILPPRLDAFARDEDYVRINAQVLRNPSVVNFLDGCAISIPCHERGAAPVGLSLFGLANSDRRLLAIADAAEQALQRRR